MSYILDIPEEQEAIEAPSGNLQNGARESWDGRAASCFFPAEIHKYFLDPIYFYKTNVFVSLAFAAGLTTATQ